MSADGPAPEAWVPVPLRARHVTAGDVLVGGNGKLWHVTTAAASVAHPGRWGVVAVHGDDVQGVEMDPDEVVSVLVPMTEREALTVARDELAARITERRTA